MFPAQALAEVMLARGWRVKLSTDDRGARYAGGFPAEVKVERVASATFARGGVAAKLLVPFRILGGVFGALLAQMRGQRPCATGVDGAAGVSRGVITVRSSLAYETTNPHPDYEGCARYDDSTPYCTTRSSSSLHCRR